MSTRSMSVAGMFYPASSSQCRSEIDGYVQSLDMLPDRPIVGALVPHAGWAYSGATAGKAYGAIAAQGAPETVLLLGAVHRWGVETASVYGAGAWRTPLGDLDIDSDLARAALDSGAGFLVDSPQAHSDEHSIEVQCPFVKHLWPASRILPVAVPPGPSASKVGAALARAAQELDRRVVAIASSDLTHYGPRYGGAPVGVGQPALDWTRANDQRLLDLVLALQADAVAREARQHHNACGAGAIAAMIGCAEVLGATQADLLEHTTSYEVRPLGVASDMVGYAAAIVY